MSRRRGGGDLGYGLRMGAGDPSHKAYGAFQSYGCRVASFLAPMGGADILARNPAQSPAAKKNFDIFPFFACVFFPLASPSGAVILVANKLGSQPFLVLESTCPGVMNVVVRDNLDPR